MNTLGKLSLTMHKLKVMPALYYKGRIVGVNLMRQYTNISQETIDSFEPSVSTPLIPEEPKHPPSAYILFYLEFLRKIRKEHNKLNIADVAKLAGAGWAKLPQEEKDVFINRYKRMFAEYKKNHDTWLNSLSAKDIHQENKRRKLVHERKLKFAEKKIKLNLIKELKDPKITTPPKSPYAYYAMKRMSEEGAGKIGLDKLEKYVFEWEKLTSEDKQPYIKEHNEAIYRYEQQMEEYKNM